MKKFLSTLLALLLSSQLVFAFGVDTSEWCCNPQHLEITATEIDLTSDLRNDYRLFEASIKNISNSELDVIIPSNRNLREDIDKIIHSGLKVSELIDLPKQIAIDCYNEDVGTGKVATAHKGIINVLGTAGSIAAGVGMLGIYPQQKFEEYVSHKRIKKEYKLYVKDIVGDFVLMPNSQQEILLFIPIKSTECIIQTNIKAPSAEVYSDYHQL